MSHSEYQSIYQVSKVTATSDLIDMVSNLKSSQELLMLGKGQAIF